MRPWNIFWKNYWAIKYLGLLTSGLRNLFCKIVKPSGPHSYILNVRSLMYIWLILVWSCDYLISSSCHMTNLKLLILLSKKKAPAMFCEKWCSSKYYNFHRKTPVMESLFNKEIEECILKNICKRLVLFCALFITR